MGGFLYVRPSFGVTSAGWSLEFAVDNMYYELMENKNNFEAGFLKMTHESNSPSM